MSQPVPASAEHGWLFQELGTGIATAIESMGSDRPRCSVSQALVELAQDSEAHSLVYDLNPGGGPSLGIGALAKGWKEIAARALAGAGMDSPTDPLCLETYREVIGQGVSLLAQSLSSRLKKELVFVAAQSTSLPVDSGIASTVEVAFGSQPPVLLYVQMAASLPGLLSAHEAPVTESGSAPPGGAVPETLGALEDLEMGVTVSLGTARLTVADALALGPGSVVQLSAELDDLVVVKVDGRTVARGEVVVVDDSYAVRITHLAALPRMPGNS